MSNHLKVRPGRRSAIQALLFISPSAVITVISIGLFFLLTGFTLEQLNMFSITILLAIIISLETTAGIQTLIYRLIDDGERQYEAIARSIKLGILWAFFFSLIASAALYPVFLGFLHFPLVYYFHFVVLLLLYSFTFVLTAAFWATGKYEFPALITTFGYLIIIALSYAAHLIYPEWTLGGYTIGVFALFGITAFAISTAFRKPKIAGAVPASLTPISRIAIQNIPAFFYQTFYVMATFLDKIIVWAVQGTGTGHGLLISGPYTVGAFLGLTPMFSIAIASYFTERASPLMKYMYHGTLSDIHQRIHEYKHTYWSGLGNLIILNFTLAALATGVGYYFFRDPATLRILVTVATGTMFLSIIVYNSSALPLFNKMPIAVVAALLVCAGELVSIPFVFVDTWAAALGFVVGSFLGFLVSIITVTRLFSHFDYNLFRIIAVTT